MDTLIVVIIVGLAVFYLARKFRRDLSRTQEKSCGCACSGCGQSAECADNGIMDAPPADESAPLPSHPQKQ